MFPSGFASGYQASHGFAPTSAATGLFLRGVEAKAKTRFPIQAFGNDIYKDRSLTVLI